MSQLFTPDRRRSVRHIQKQVADDLNEAEKSVISDNCTRLGPQRVATLREMLAQAAGKLRDRAVAEQIVSQSKQWSKEELCSWLAHTAGVALEKIPSSFVDTHSLRLMTDPCMLLPGGQTYDRTTCENIINQKQSSTNNIYKWTCVPNYTLKSAIKEFVEKHAPDPKQKMDAAYPDAIDATAVPANLLEQVLVQKPSTQRKRNHSGEATVPSLDDFVVNDRRAQLQLKGEQKIKQVLAGRLLFTLRPGTSGGGALPSSRYQAFSTTDEKLTEITKLDQLETFARAHRDKSARYQLILARHWDTVDATAVEFENLEALQRVDDLLLTKSLVLFDRALTQFFTNEEDIRNVIREIAVVTFAPQKNRIWRAVNEEKKSRTPLRSVTEEARGSWAQQGARYELFSRAMQSKPIHKEKIKELQGRVAANCRALGKTSVADLRAMVTTAANQMSNTQLAQRVQSQARRWTKPQLCSWLSCNDEVAVDEVPKSFLDGVTLAVMLDPHIIVDSGHSFDRGTIDKLVPPRGERRPRCPITKKAITQTRPNIALRVAIYQFLFEHGIADTDDS